MWVHLRHKMFLCKFFQVISTENYSRLKSPSFHPHGLFNLSDKYNKYHYYLQRIEFTWYYLVVILYRSLSHQYQRININLRTFSCIIFFLILSILPLLCVINLVSNMFKFRRFKFWIKASFNFRFVQWCAMG